ncbi:MAG TPA: GAF domain-containing protein [Polyangiaceae bacterium]|nr:GAF domain-containing protein [Polyangiaceae bacterium]
MADTSPPEEPPSPEKQVALAFEQELMGVARVGRDGRIRGANETFAAMLQQSAESLRGRELVSLVNEASRARLHESLFGAVESPLRPVFELEFDVPDGPPVRSRTQFRWSATEGVLFALPLVHHGATNADVSASSQRPVEGQARALELMAKGAELSDVLDALCDVIERPSAEAVFAGITLVQDDRQHLRLVGGRQLRARGAEIPEGWAIGPLGGACGRAVAEARRVVCDDIAADISWSGPLREWATRQGFLACSSTPIFSSGGKVLGTVALYLETRRPPRATELEPLLDIVGRTAGIAIERKQGEDGLKTHSERLRLLWETAAVLMTTDEPEALIRALFERIAPHLGLDMFLNHMLDETPAGNLALFSFAGITPEAAGTLSRINLSSPLLGEACRTLEPHAVSQQTGDLLNELAVLGVRAYAAFPLVAGEQLLGVVSFGSRDKRQFEVDEIEFMRTVTRYLTVAYERLRLVRQLRDADRKKDDFIALLAHELRNPLAPLRNGLAVMRLADDAKVVERARTIMERQLSHLVRLIDDLLDLSRIGLNKLELRRGTVSLAEVISHAVDTARPLIDAADHELVIALPEQDVMLDADLTRLSQVFGNVLTNAAKYTPKHGKIRLAAVLEGDRVVVSVTDNGIGLRPESLRSIFAMFSQVDHGLGRNSGGLGIGLALVKGLLDLHGGSIAAESEGLGKGSRFTVSLPLAAHPAPQPQAGGQANVRTSWRILLVEDNRDAAESLATTLRLWGNEVSVAHDGLEAIERAERLRPQVIVMDLGMPHLDGYEATRRIRRLAWGQEPVIVALSGWGQESNKRASREAGCDDHLVKPVEPVRLLETVSALRLARSSPT